MKKNVLGGLIALAAIVCGFGLADQGHTQVKPVSSKVEASAISAYIYGYPLVLENMTEAAATAPQAIATGQGAPVNQFWNNSSLANASSTAVVTQSVDVLYSTAWLDLSAEPLIFHIPATESDRYYVMQVMDGWTNVFADPGSRTTGNGAQDYVIVGPHWNGPLPSGLPVLRSPTDLVWIIGRIEVNGDQDVPKVNAIQAGLSLTPLHAYTGSPGPSPTPSASASPSPSPSQPSNPTPTQKVAQLDTLAYFRNLAREMCASPAAAADAPAIQQFRSFGFVPCHSFNPSATVLAQLQDVPKKAQQQIAQHAQQLGVTVNGWRINTQNLGRYGTDYNTRAAAALVGLGANLPEDAVYPATSIDSTGQPLTGAKKYRIHFDAGQLPPVDGFWSLTLYDSQNHFVANSIDRYAINDKSALQFNSDGSLDIFIQTQPPQNSPQSNWLPAPSGPFNLVLRLYAPKAEVLNGKWSPPPVVQESQH